MKALRRVLSLALVVGLLLAFGTVATADDDIQIKLIICEYSNHTEEYMNKIIAAYEAEHPGVKVNLEMCSWDDVGTRVSTLIAGNQAPDILNIDAFSQYLEDNLLLPASSYTSDALASNLYESFYKNNVDASGTIYALPIVASVRSLYYSKAIFKEVGIEKAPATWTELEEDCKKIQEFYKGSVYPWGVTFSTNEGQATFAYYAWNNGGGFKDADGNWALNSDLNVKAVDFAVSLYKNGYTNQNPLTESRDDLQAVMSEGKIAMMITANFFPGLYPDLELGVAPIPHSDAIESPVQLGVQDVMMVFDNKDSDAKLKAISEFFDSFYADTYYPEWCNTEGLLPATQSGCQTLAAKSEFFATYLDLLKGAKFYPTTDVNWKTAQYAVIEAVQEVASGAMDAKSALDAAQQKVLDEIG